VKGFPISFFFRYVNGEMEARVGFEPTNGGFADLSLGPLGYRAQCPSVYRKQRAMSVRQSELKKIGT
jgi:hypothetical protein